MNIETLLKLGQIGSVPGREDEGAVRAIAVFSSVSVWCIRSPLGRLGLSVSGAVGLSVDARYLEVGEWCLGRLLAHVRRHGQKIQVGEFCVLDEVVDLESQR